MILKIDTADNSVEVDTDMNLGELVILLAKLYPEDQWKEVRLKPKYPTWSTYTSPHKLPLTTMPTYIPATLPYMGTDVDVKLYP